MSFTRRQLLKASLGVAASTAPTFLLQHATLARASESNSLAVGDATLTTVSDGHLVLPREFLLPDNVSTAEVDALVEAYALDSNLFEPACNCTLWQHGDRKVLFDVGAGPNFMPTAGSLVESLDGIGIDVSEITDVVFTHAHPDHLWGLIDDFDELLFADANYYIHEREWDFWSADSTLEALPESRKSFAVGAKNRFTYLEDRINLFRYGDEVISGIEAMDTAGHTPGHTSFALHNGSESIMLLGDAITHPIVSFVKHDWPVASDHDSEQAKINRGKLLDRLSAEQLRLVGFHLPYPGTGRAEKHEGAYRFVAS